MDKYLFLIFLVFIMIYFVWSHLNRVEAKIGELSDRLDKSRLDSRDNIGSYSVSLQIVPRWEKVWELIAKADGKASGDEVIKVIRHYQDNGFNPDREHCFKGEFSRKIFEDLNSGLQLHFNSQGELVNPESVEQGWAVYDNAKDCPVEISDANFVSAYFTLGRSTFEVDQRKVDQNSIMQFPKPVRSYLHTGHGEIFQFIKALIRLESKGYTSQRPFLAIPGQLADKLASQNIRHVMDEGWWRDGDESAFGFEFGMCDGWYGHQLQSEFLDFYIDVESFTPRLYLLEERSV